MPSRPDALTSSWWQPLRHRMYIRKTSEMFPELMLMSVNFMPEAVTACNKAQQLC